MNDDKAEKIALFRYGLIAPLVLGTLPRGELTRRAMEIAARLYDTPHSTRRWTLSRRTFAVIWCGGLPMPSCAGTKARSNTRC